MNYLGRRISNWKSSSKSSSNKNATQNKPQEPELARDELVLLGNPAKRFDWEDVKRGNWRVLGEGTVGRTYKVDLEDGTTTVVVKRLKDVVLSAHDFRDAVEALGAMDHENLLPLRGYLYSKNQKLLLYDFIPLGSLADLLRIYRAQGWSTPGWNTPLGWEVRLWTALRAARAIEHLHSQDIPHGNIKSSNVLLTPSNGARVSDYGLAPLTRSSLSGGGHTTRADVYGFGALLLELLTGKPPTQPRLWYECPAWVESVAPTTGIAQALDVDLRTIHHDIVQGMVELLELTIRCVSSNPKERPRMSDVRKKIEELCSQTSFWLTPSLLEDMENDMSTRRQPDGVLEVSESSESIEATEDPILSRPSSPNSMSSGFHYDVFLSFRGPDTRSGITDFLYTSLVAARIHTYRDDDELSIGEEISPELLKAINHSKISIPIFSKGYAFSKWCLNELVQMVECKKSRRQKIMPIFYNVTPSEVRHQTGSYGDAFVSHEKQFDSKVIRKWKDALKEVGDLKGWDMDSMTTRREGELVNHIVQKVIGELKKASLLVTDCLVSVEHHVKEIKRMVCGNSEDIQILGIHGMGGVGKTTLAKILYNHLSYRFEDCCFISNVRETSQLKGIECLQNQLLSDILKRNWSNISNVDDGIKKIKERLCGKKVLLLLDDVDERTHLNALMARPVWFGKGSRIIITSRNMDVFNLPEVSCTYELTGMDFNQSLQLFCKHAFGRDYPLDEYAAFSYKVVKMTGGLPLALNVIGSQLRGKSKDVWDVTLEKLEKVPHEEVKRKLKICYDTLDYRQKQIFLDIALSYIGFDKRTVLPLLPSDLFPGEGLQVLQQRSLVKIGEDNKLWMHVQLRDLARDMVRE